MKDKILKLLKENKNGMTLTQIAKKLKTTIYIIKGVIGGLESEKSIEVIKVGASHLVRLK